MYHRVILELPELLVQRLAAAADREHRDVKQQAVAIIERELMRRQRRSLWQSEVSKPTAVDLVCAPEGAN